VVAVGAVAGFVVARNSGAASGKAATTAANGYGAASAASGRLLARVDQLPRDGGLILAGDKIVLTSGSDGAVHAFSAVCTHQGCTVSSVSRGQISCPCHGSRFDARTGAVVAGPAPAPLASIPITVRDGGVYSA
jgi:Rieske Fe-S protein